MYATAKDLRFYSKELLDAVKRGEEVIITYRGKPYAKLVPLNESKQNVDKKSKLFGIWKDYDFTSSVDDYVRNMRKGRL